MNNKYDKWIDGLSKELNSRKNILNDEFWTKEVGLKSYMDRGQVINTFVLWMFGDKNMPGDLISLFEFCGIKDKYTFVKENDLVDFNYMECQIMLYLIKMTDDDVILDKVNDDRLNKFAKKETCMLVTDVDLDKQLDKAIVNTYFGQMVDEISKKVIRHFLIAKSIRIAKDKLDNLIPSFKGTLGTYLLAE